MSSSSENPNQKSMTATTEEEDVEDLQEQESKEDSASPKPQEEEEEEEAPGLVSNMIDEAMTEQEKRSETSSSSKSYEVLMIKTNSESGHTSGDDLETATSSDIEVIASPSQCIVSPASSHNGHHGLRHGNMELLRANKKGTQYF